MTLCTWQHERGALFIIILTDSEERFRRDLRQMETGARLESNLPAMNRSRVWTNSFTVALQIQATPGVRHRHPKPGPKSWFALDDRRCSDENSALSAAKCPGVPSPCCLG